METKKSNPKQFSNETEKSGTSKSNSDKKVSMKASQLMQLFEDSLKDIYWAEKALVKAMPKMIKKTTPQELNKALSSHLDETKIQIERLEEVFTLIEKKASAKKCDAMEGLIVEATDIMESCEEGSMRDAGIISAAQKIEHYEIATYGTLRQFAQTLKLQKVVELLEKTLQEEKESDLLLSEVAMDAINIEAAEEAA